MSLQQRTILPASGIVTDPRLWATSAGYEFQIGFGDLDVTGSMSATEAGTQGYGWSGVSGGGGIAPADFLSSSDREGQTIGGPGTPGLSSPRIFGSYDHALQASRFLGYMPTLLTMEGSFNFSTASANETTTFFGFTAHSVVDAAAANSGACIRSGGTASTFFLTSDNGSDAGASIDTSWHVWKIEVGSTDTNWYIDNVHQGSITTEADIWPLSWHVFVGTTNRINMSWLRIFYS